MENKRILSIVGFTFVVIYLVLFISLGLHKLVEYNVWFAFLLCVILSLGGLILSILSIFKERRVALPLIAAVLSLLLIVFTIYVFLLPEAGIPPLIPLFYD